MRLLLVGFVGLVVAGIVLTGVVAARARARQHNDWLQGKNLTLAPVVKGLKEPTFVVGPPDGSNRLFIGEREGRIKVADGDGNLKFTPFLDVTQDTSTSTEQGMLGLAFHPDFKRNGYVYVDRTAADGTILVIRYTVSPEKPDQVDPATGVTILNIPKKSKYHNGGDLAFGPDGMLYVSVGDDESSEQAQLLGSLYGKILRLDVDAAAPYAIPATNPFAAQPGARGEIWAYGFRNPWRFSFDRQTGDLWIGDVGDARMEELDFQPAASGGGENYGWPFVEGTDCMDAEHCHDAGLVAPVTTYGHDMNCALMGGYVYRGPTATALQGSYLFGDLCTGGIFSLRGSAEQGYQRVELGFNPIKIDSFGQDPNGDVYVSDMQGGVVYKVMDGFVPATP
jgi:glucose/arabinose dehydrogenase